LALVGYDGLVIVAILIIVFLWGPQKLPEMARSIGEAKREFEKAAKEDTSAPYRSSVTNQDTPDPLIVAAKSLGILTEGKTREEIAKEISNKTEVRN